MTKIFSMLAIGLLSCFMASAQIKKGSFLIGGQIGGGNSSTTQPSITNEQKNFNAMLSLGTVIKENLVIGLNFGYQKNEFIYQNQTPQEQKGYSAGVFIRKYSLIGQKFYFYGDANARYHSVESTSTSAGFPGIITTQKANGISVGLTPGLSYQVYKRLLLDVSLPNLLYVSQEKIETTNDFNSDKSTNKSFNTGIGLNGTALSNLAVGFRIIL